jgi:hypothetical protein
MASPLSILIVATKPPWPPVDGGRVAVLNTVDALTAAGHRVTLVAPVDPAADVDVLRSALAGSCRVELVPSQLRTARTVLLSSLLQGRPVTMVRHRLPAVQARVQELVETERFDVVQAEQLQAVAQAAPATARGVPLVYRAHNVESALWTYTASFGRPLSAALLRREARRLAVVERATIHRAAVTVVLTDLDAEPLRRSAGAGPRIERVPLPFAAELPAAERELPGRPAVVTLASPTWVPSREMILHVASCWWPAVRRRLPEAQLHVFGGVDGGDRQGITWHRAPTDSAEAYPAGAVVAIAARHPTGVPVKGLEAWSRGVPLVASSETAAALEADGGRELLVADDPETFAGALERVAADAILRSRLIDGGRSRLRSHHDPARVAGQLTELYRSLKPA